MDSEIKNVPQDVLLQEYEKTQSMAIHYDTMNMHFSAIMTAGVFVLWGLIFKIDSGSIAILKIPTIVVLIEIFVFSILSIWLRYITIHRRIIVQKFNRIHDIEEHLGMKQHRIFRYTPQSIAHRPGGHSTEILLYFALSGFGVLVAVFSQIPPTPADLLQWASFALHNWSFNQWLRFLVSIAPVPYMVIHSTRCKYDVISHIHGYSPPWYLRLLFRFFAFRRPVDDEEQLIDGSH